MTKRISLLAVIVMIVAVLFCFVGCEESTSSSSYYPGGYYSSSSMSYCQTYGHSWSGGSCTTAQICSYCNQSGSKLDHVWVNATCEAPKTCSNCNTTEGEKLPHNVENDVCTVCGYENPETAQIKVGKKIYDNLVAINVMNSEFGSVIYDAWYFAIYESDDVSPFSDGMQAFATATGFKKEAVDAATIKYLKSLNYTESQITSSHKLAAVSTNSGAIGIVLQIFEDTGMTAALRELLDETKELIKGMSSEYESKTKLSVLQSFYSNTNDYYSFVTSPSGSFSTLASTLNSHKSKVSQNMNELEFVYG